MASPHMSQRDPERQGWCTPQEFLRSVEERFGRISWDLAASPGNEVCGGFFSPDMDSLSQSWGQLGEGNAWLNPPYNDIRPWVSKLDLECQELARWTLCLVPYSAGANWWRDHVHEKCVVYSVGRMRFVSPDGIPAKDIYPKDLALLAYGYGARGVVPKWSWG